jgi:hypothetical protein
MLNEIRNEIEQIIPNMIEDFGFVEELLTVDEWHHLEADSELKETVQGENEEEEESGSAITSSYGEPSLKKLMLVILCHLMLKQKVTLAKLHPTWSVKIISSKNIKSTNKQNTIVEVESDRSDRDKYNVINS